MTDQFEKYVSVVSIKEEYEDNSYADDIQIGSSNTINVNDIELNDEMGCNNIMEYETINVKAEYTVPEIPNIVNENGSIKEEVGAVDIEINLKSEILFCKDCCVEYHDYCSKCGMLRHILNGNTNDGIPKGILEIGDSFGHFGIFALKLIPEGVNLGPITGTTEHFWRIKGGKLLIADDKMNIFNWMQYVNSTEDTHKRNLLVFQYNGGLYYRSSRDIQRGEELFVHFGEKYDASLKENVEMQFNPIIVSEVEDVFACTFCCLGFSSKLFLLQHKTICPYKIQENFTVSELTQCPSCKINLGREEYLEHHVTYCDGEVNRRIVTSPQEPQPAGAKGRSSILKEPKRRQRSWHKCELCKYKTSYKTDLKLHVDRHYEVKKYKCEICSRRFTTEEALTLHATNKHVNFEEFNAIYGDSLRANATGKHLQGCYKCVKCAYRTGNKSHLKQHVMATHLMEKEFKCAECAYQTNYKSDLKKHARAKHLNDCRYKCALCPYKNSYKTNLDRHVKAKHVNERGYVCAECDFKTNYKADLKKHVKVKHQNVKDYKCAMCAYETSYKTNMDRHVLAKHVRKKEYKCAECEYRVGFKSCLDVHVKAKHLKESDYNCPDCDFKTNYMSCLEDHTRAEHANEASHYKCAECEFKTAYKSVLKNHIRAKHNSEKEHRCDECDYRTNYKSDLRSHVNAKHMGEKEYGCAECAFKSSYKSALSNHVRTRHAAAKEFECEACGYATNRRSDLKAHIRSKHLKEVYYKCGQCAYASSYKSNLRKHVKGKHSQGNGLPPI